MDEKQKAEYLSYLQKEHNLTPDQASEYLAYTQNQEAPKENERGAFGQAARAVDYTGGLSRAAAYDAVGNIIGNPDLVTEEDYAKAANFNKEAPDSEEYLKRMGMEEGLLRSGAGFASDVLVDAGNFVPGLNVVEWVGKGLKGAGALAKKGPKLLDLLGRSLEKTGKFVAHPKEILPEASTIGQALSGAPKDALQTVYNNPSEVSNIIKGGSDAMVDKASELKEALKAALYNEKGKIASELNAATDGVGKGVDISAAKRSYDDGIKKLEANKELASQPEMQERIANLKEQRRKIFGENKFEEVDTGLLDQSGNPIKTKKQISKEVDDIVTPSTALEIDAQLKDVADIASTKQGITSRFGEKESKAAKAAKEESRFARDEIKNSFDKVTEGKSSQLRGKFKDVYDAERVLKGPLSSDQSALNTFRNITGKTKQVAFKTLKEQAPDLAKEAEVLRAASIFENPSWVPMSGQGSTSTSRSLLSNSIGALVGGGAGYEKGGLGGIAPGAVFGAAISSPAAMYNIANVSGRTPKLLKKGLDKASDLSIRRGVWHGLMSEIDNNMKEDKK